MLDVLRRLWFTLMFGSLGCALDLFLAFALCDNIYSCCRCAGQTFPQIAVCSSAGASHSSSHYTLVDVAISTLLLWHNVTIHLRMFVDVTLMSRHTPVFIQNSGIRFKMFPPLKGFPSVWTNGLSDFPLGNLGRMCCLYSSTRVFISSVDVSIAGPSICLSWRATKTTKLPLLGCLYHMERFSEENMLYKI